MDAYSIRRATLDDAEEILRHRRLMFQDMGHAGAVLDRIETASRPELLRMMKEEIYLGWLALDDKGKIIAGAGLHIGHMLTGPLSPDDARRAYIYNVYTYPDARRRGLAKRLTLEILDWCRAQGIRVVWLHASEQGRLVYDSLGFKATNEMKIILPPPDPTQR